MKQKKATKPNKPMKFNMKALLDPFSSDPYEKKVHKSKASKVKKVSKKVAQTF